MQYFELQQLYKISYSIHIRPIPYPAMQNLYAIEGIYYYYLVLSAGDGQKEKKQRFN